MPMMQFVVWKLGTKRMLMTIDTTRYDFMLGFHRFVKELPCPQATT